MSVEYLPKFFKFVYIEDGVTKTAYLDDEPIGWDKVPIILKRDLTYHGVNYQFTDGDVQLEFDDAAKVDIIELIYGKDGQDGSIVLQYGYTNPDTTETTEYEGKLNLNTRKKANGRVTCTIETAGFHELLNSRNDTPVNLFDSKTLDGITKATNTPVDITLHSKKLQRVCQVKGGDFDPASAELPTNQDDDFWFTLTFADPEPNDIDNFYGNGVSIFDTNPIPDNLDNFQVWTLAEAGDYQFYLDLYFRLHGNQIPHTIGIGPHIEYYDVDFYFEVYATGATTPKYTRTVYTEHVDYGPTSTNASWDKMFHFSDNFTIEDLAVGDSIYLYGKFDLNGEGDWTGLEVHVDTENPWPQRVVILKCIALTEQPSSLAKGMLIYESLQSIVESITNTNNLVKSEFFGRIANGYLSDGTGSKFFLSNGFFIRNFNTANRALTISLSSLLTSLRSIWNIGVGYEYISGVLKIVIEDIGHFFQDNLILHIAECSDYTEETAKEFIYNDIEVGYSKFQDEGQYLLDEFNTKLQFATPIKTNKQKLPLLSDLITSGYAIEDTRRQQFAEKPADSTTYDDDNFLIAALYDSGWKSEKNENFETANILDPDTAYNLRLTPKRNLLRWARWINGGLSLKKGYELLKNTLFKMNGDAQTKLTGESDFMQEKSDIALSNFGSRARIFSPNWITFKTRLTIDQLRTVKDAFNGLDLTRQNGYISAVNDIGETVEGWLYELQFTPAKEEVFVKLLKKDLSTPVASCADYAGWTFENFESSIVPSWIEDCTFANFN